MAKENSNTNVDPTNARDPKYKEVMTKMVQDSECPLCPPLPYHPNPILREDGLWLITKSGFPYENTEHHLLMIAMRHIEQLSDLSANDMKSMIGLAQWAEKEFKFEGGGLTMRFGDTKFTGATIKHLHAHLIVPELDENGKAKPVYFPIG